MSMQLKVLEWIGLYKPVDYDHKRFDRLARRLESPIERIFWSAAYFELAKHGQLTPQVRIDGYRLDFAYLVNGRKVAIELDGHEYHSHKDQMTRDYKRQRYLQGKGWRVVRFTGSEIYQDAQRCVFDVLKIAEV